MEWVKDKTGEVLVGPEAPGGKQVRLASISEVVGMRPNVAHVQKPFGIECLPTGDYKTRDELKRACEEQARKNFPHLNEN